MGKTDPIDEFGRLIKQVKVQEYERGWREAMEAIQRAAITLYRQSSVASEAASSAEADGHDRVTAALQDAAQAASSASAEAQEPQEPSAEGQANAGEGGGEGQQRFVTPKWALLKR